MNDASGIFARAPARRLPARARHGGRTRAAPARADRGRTAVLQRRQPAGSRRGECARADHRHRHDARAADGPRRHFRWLTLRGVGCGRPARPHRAFDALVLASVILVGALLGATNGLFVARLGLPSVVVTLATMVIWRDSLRWVTEGAWVQDLPAGFQWFGLPQRTGEWAIVLAALGVLLAGGLAACGRWRPGARSMRSDPTTKPHAWWACAPIWWCSGSSRRSARARRWPPC